MKPDSQQKGEPLYLLELKLYPDIILTDDIIREIYDAIQFDSVQLGFDGIYKSVYFKFPIYNLLTMFLNY